MRWSLIAIIILLVLILVSVATGTATDLQVNGGTIQQFDLEANIDFTPPCTDADSSLESLESGNP